MSETLSVATKHKREEFELPFEFLPINLRYKFLDKLSWFELWTVLGRRDTWVSSPILQWEQETLRYCASRHIRTLRQEKDYGGLMIPKICLTDEDNCTQASVDFLKLRLKPIKCHIPCIALTSKKNEAILEEYQCGAALKDLFQHFSATKCICGLKITNIFLFKCVTKINHLDLNGSQTYSIYDLLSFGVNTLGFRFPGLPTRTILTLLKVPPYRIGPPIRFLVFYAISKWEFVNILRDAIMQSIERRDGENYTEVMLTFGADNIQWLCTTDYTTDPLIPVCYASFKRIPRYSPIIPQ